MGGQVGLVKVNALPGGGGGVFHVEQVQPVGNACVCAGDGDVKKPGLYGAEAEGHLKLRPGGDEPAVVLNPGVGLLKLVAHMEFLLKQAVVVVEAHPVPGQPQGGDGVQEAGGQAAQPAVAQGGLGLTLLNFGQGLPGLLQSGPGLFKKPQVDQVVGEKLSHQKLGGDVIELLISGNAGGLGQFFFGHGQKRPVDIRVLRLT